MSNCPSCKGVVTKDATRCPHCGFEGAQRAESSTGAGERPAHLAMLEGGGAPPPPPPMPRAMDQKAKPRIVSKAGPAMPAMSGKLDDSVPSGASGWLARLEAAKRGGQGAEGQSARSSAPPPGAPSAAAVTPGQPPPLKKAAPAPTPPRKSIEAKPAHLLLAELEREEHERKRAARERKASQVENGEEPSNAIAELEIAKPTASINIRQIPKWVVALVLLVAVAGFGAFGLHKGQKDPVKAKELDPALIAAKARLEQAVAARDLATTLLLQAKYQESIPHFEKALELEPNMAKAELGLGGAHAGLGDNEAACRHYRRYLRLDADAPDAAAVQAIVDKCDGASKSKPPKQ